MFYIKWGPDLRVCAIKNYNPVPDMNWLSPVNKPLLDVIDVCYKVLTHIWFFNEPYSDFSDNKSYLIWPESWAFFSRL